MAYGPSVTAVIEFHAIHPEALHKTCFCTRLLLNYPGAAYSTRVQCSLRWQPIVVSTRCIYEEYYLPAFLWYMVLITRGLCITGVLLLDHINMKGEPHDQHMWPSRHAQSSSPVAFSCYLPPAEGFEHNCSPNVARYCSSAVIIAQPEKFYKWSVLLCSTMIMQYAWSYAAQMWLHVYLPGVKLDCVRISWRLRLASVDGHCNCISLRVNACCCRSIYTTVCWPTLAGWLLKQTDPCAPAGI